MFLILVPFIVLQRDLDSVGSIKIDGKGKSVCHYKLSKHDCDALTKGSLEAMDLLISSGAKEVWTCHEGYCPFDDNIKGNVKDEGYLEYKLKIARDGLQPGFNCTAFSAHQMGTCRLSSSPVTGATKPSGQLWEDENVWICDGSLFPTASGVNPMVTIYAVCDIISKNCREFLENS
jgi:long-chain-alcohol oxidase